MAINNANYLIFIVFHVIKSLFLSEIVGIYSDKDSMALSNTLALHMMLLRNLDAPEKRRGGDLCLAGLGLSET